MPAASEAIPIQGAATATAAGGGIGTEHGSGAFADSNSVRLDSVDDLSHSLEVFNSMEMLRYTQNNGDDDNTPAAIAPIAEISNALPVDVLPGEVLESTTDTGSGSVYITNYRIVILDRVKNAVACIPVLSVDLVEFWSGDPYGIQIICKYGRIFRLRCASEVQVELHKKLQKATCNVDANDIFAWYFAKAVKAMKEPPHWLKFGTDTGDLECLAKEEFVRLKYNSDFWRVSNVNNDYALCSTYPKSVIIPKDITDDELREVCKARNNARFPAAVWCCAKNESVLLRSSQPCCGIFNYRFPLDEKLLECARKAVSRGRSSRKLLIVDCRSYSAVIANRIVKGGGAESEEYYQETEVIFRGLANIHQIRNSFHKLRMLLAGPEDQATVLQAIQSTSWLQHLISLIDTAQKCVKALVDEGRSVLVHCTDGWDRTTQIVTLAKIIADPYYRTFEGFKNLIRRDWIDFGHKFADRLGIQNSFSGESSPVFLQWLDCVHQLHHMFPDAFQFTLSYLTKLALHCYSGLFGTFLWNSQSEKRHFKKKCEEMETLSLWSFLDESKPEFGNVIYDANSVKNKRRLHTSLRIEDLHIWKQVYVGPTIERLINDQTLSNSGMVASQHSEVDRASLNRAHSAESLSNISNADPVASSSQTSSNATFVGNAHSQFHSSTTRTSISSEADYARPDENDLSFSEYRERDRNAIGKEIDYDGLTKVAETREEKTREKVENLQEQLNTLRERVKLFFSEEGIRKVSGVCGESPRADFVFGEGSSASCSVDSVVSNISMIDRDDAADISDGSKGWLMDNVSQKCMACQEPFHLGKRKHHCRNCGRIFCSMCTRHSFFRVRDNRGENVRVCDECYTRMTANRPHISAFQPPPPPKAPGPQNHDTAGKPPTTFMIGSTDGQTVYG